MAITSFYHAIYKRLWAVARSSNTHMDDGTADGGFTLRAADDPHGPFGTIKGPTGGALIGLPPLPVNEFVADNNPLYRVLLKSLDVPEPVTTPVNGANWPVMPPASSGTNKVWNALKVQSPSVLDKLKEWIEVNHKPKDIPHGGNLDFAHWSGGPAAFPTKGKQVLFVCSIDQDNGVRPGAIDPNTYWNTSQIFVCDETGQIQEPPPPFKAGKQHTIQAIIGNSSDLTAGAQFGTGTLPPVQVQCNAYVWNSGFSPLFPLPEMSALVADSAGATYEQPALTPKSYAVVGFRFDVDQVFKGLHDAIVAAGMTPAQLGTPTIDDWLKGTNAHACVKVLVRANEFPDTPMGGFPDEMTALPTSDRHIAQRNLAAFDMAVKGTKKLQWQNFMVGQAGKGLNALAINAALPADAVRYYLAVPTPMFERHIAPQKGTRGFERVTDLPSKPFPDAVILRRTTPEARLEIGDHGGRDKFFGMALGVEWEPPLLARARTLGDISVAQRSHDGTVIGGFTLRPQPVR